MPTFLQLVRFELCTLFTRKELNILQTVCSQWKEEISRRSHLLARFFSEDLHISAYGSVEAGTPMTFELESRADVCTQLDCTNKAKRLVGQRFCPMESTEAGMRIYFELFGTMRCAHVADYDYFQSEVVIKFRNELTLEASIALLQVFFRLRGKCLNQINQLHMINPLFFELLDELTNQTYSLHFKQGEIVRMDTLFSMQNTFMRNIRITTLELEFESPACWADNYKPLLNLLCTRRDICSVMEINVQLQTDAELMERIIQVN